MTLCLAPFQFLAPGLSDFLLPSHYEEENSMSRKRGGRARQRKRRRRSPRLLLLLSGRNLEKRARRWAGERGRRVWRERRERTGRKRAKKTREKKERKGKTRRKAPCVRCMPDFAAVSLFPFSFLSFFFFFSFFFRQQRGSEFLLSKLSSLLDSPHHDLPLLLLFLSSETSWPFASWFPSILASFLSFFVPPSFSFALLGAKRKTKRASFGLLSLLPSPSRGFFWIKQNFFACSPSLSPPLFFFLSGSFPGTEDTFSCFSSSLSSSFSRLAFFLCQEFPSKASFSFFFLSLRACKQTYHHSTDALSRLLFTLHPVFSFSFFLSRRDSLGCLYVPLLVYLAIHLSSSSSSASVVFSLTSVWLVFYVLVLFLMVSLLSRQKPQQRARRAERGKPTNRERFLLSELFLFNLLFRPSPRAFLPSLLCLLFFSRFLPSDKMVVRLVLKRLLKGAIERWMSRQLPTTRHPSYVDKYLARTYMCFEMVMRMDTRTYMHTPRPLQGHTCI